MIPRGRPDIGWTDLCAALAGGLVPGDYARCRARAAAAFRAGENCVTCLSVRSGWDLVLRATEWPPGSELIVSAINLDDMLRIARHHGLVPVPVDVDPATLAVDASELEKTVTQRTRAILVAHLFGSRMPMVDIVAIAERHKLFLVEDCAQAFSGDEFRGHPASDVSLFSFGPIKTRTALGGALLRFRDPVLFRRAEALEGHYPLQGRLEFLRRVGVFTMLKALSSRALFSPFALACRWLGVDYDRLLQNAVRGFAGENLIDRLRRRPALGLLRFLARRLQAAGPADTTARVGYARRLTDILPESAVVGADCEEHTHWVIPIRSADPAKLIARMRRAGFDGTRAASRLCAVSREGALPPAPAAAALLEQIVYLPMWPQMKGPDLRRLAEIVTADALQHSTSPVARARPV
jgi:dTDP-4-amino-4,6-dideoxygalactose transaminase